MRKKCYEGPGYRLSQAWRFLIGWAVFFLLLTYDPIGLTTVSERWLVRVVNYMGAPLYQSAVRDEIVVVIADPTSRETLKLGWPLKYDVQADVIGKITNLKPRMLAIDMMFLDQHRDDSVEFLWDAIDEGADISPIFGAAAPRIGLDLKIIENEDGQPLPFAQADITTDSTWPDMGYRFASDNTLDVGRPPSLALAMYKELCTGNWEQASMLSRDYKEACRNQGSISSQGTFDQSAFDRDMLVFWGSGLPDYADLFDGKFDIANRLFNCRVDSRPFLQRLIEAVTLQKTEFTETTCAFHPVIPLDVLMNIDQEVLRPAIEGKIVFYGVDHPGIADIVNPPTSQPIAGVHLHAMALDNLLTWGPDYLGKSSRYYPGIGSQSLSRLQFLMSFAIFMVILLVSFLWYPHEAERNARYAPQPATEKQVLAFSNLKYAICHYLCNVVLDFVGEIKHLTAGLKESISDSTTYQHRGMVVLLWTVSFLPILMLRTVIGSLIFLSTLLCLILYLDLFVLMVPPINALVLIGVLAFVKLVVPLRAFTPGEKNN